MRGCSTAAVLSPDFEKPPAAGVELKIVAAQITLNLRVVFERLQQQFDFGAWLHVGDRLLAGVEQGPLGHEDSLCNTCLTRYFETAKAERCGRICSAAGILDFATRSARTRTCGVGRRDRRRSSYSRALRSASSAVMKRL
jgi:hypothetical protein